MRIGNKFASEGDVQAAVSGTVNGSNTAFTLGFTPDDSLSVLLHVNGLLQTQGTDYTISGSNITMTTAPVLGQKLVCYYRKKLN